MESRENTPVESEGRIFEDNKNLIHAILKNCFKTDIKNLSYEDLFQEGCVGLLKAIRSYDAYRKVKFGFYATICIRNEIRSYIMRNRYRGTKVSKKVQYESMEHGTTDELIERYSVQLYGNQIPDGFTRDYAPSAEEEAVAYIHLEDTINSITPERYKTILWKYIETLSVKQTAEELGVSKDSVYDAINRLKDNYYKDA